MNRQAGQCEECLMWTTVRLHPMPVYGALAVLCEPCAREIL